MGEVRDANDLKIEFRLGKTRFFYLQGVDVVEIFYVLVDDRHVRLLRNLVGDNGDTCRIRSDVVDKNIRVGIAQKSVDVSNMERRVLHEIVDVITTYRDNYLLS